MFITDTKTVVRRHITVELEPDMYKQIELEVIHGFDNVSMEEFPVADLLDLATILPEIEFPDELYMYDSIGFELIVEHPDEFELVLLSGPNIHRKWVTVAPTKTNHEWWAAVDNLASEFASELGIGDNFYTMVGATK